MKDDSLDGKSYTVEVKVMPSFNAETQVLTMCEEFDDLMKRVIEKRIEFTEECTRKALIALGWTPPISVAQRKPAHSALWEEIDRLEETVSELTRQNEAFQSTYNKTGIEVRTLRKENEKLGKLFLYIKRRLSLNRVWCGTKGYKYHGVNPVVHELIYKKLDSFTLIRESGQE